MVSVGENITQTQLDALAALANDKLAPGTPYAFAEGASNFEQEWQRIRDDLFDKIFDDNTSPIYKSKDALVSSPQIVGINPCPLGDGRLYLGDHEDPIPETDYLPLFKDVEFWYSDYRVPPLKVDHPDFFADDSDVGADGSVPVTLFRKLKFSWSDFRPVHWEETEQEGDPSGTRSIFDAPYSVDWTQTIEVPSDETRVFIEIEIPIVWQGEGEAPDPDKNDFVFTVDTPGAQSFSFVKKEHWQWETLESTIGWKFKAWVWLVLNTGKTEINYEVTSNSHWLFGEEINDVMPDEGDPGTTWPETPEEARGDNFAGEDNGESQTRVVSYTWITLQKEQPEPVEVDIIHPGGAGFKVSIPEFEGDLTQYLSNESRGAELIEVAPPNLRGVWIAKTLPTPAVNVFLDQDFPPYIRQLIKGPTTLMFPDGTFTFSPLLPVGDNYFLQPSDTPTVVANPRSSVKQAAPYDPDAGAFETAESTFSLAGGGTVSGELIWPWWLYPPAPPVAEPQEFALVLSVELDVFVSDSPGIDPDNPATYEYSATTQIITTAELNAVFGNWNRRLYYVFRNPGGDTDVTLFKTVYTREPEIYYPVEPSCGDQVAVWPVMRDTDDWPLRLDLDSKRGSDRFEFTLDPGDYAQVAAVAVENLSNFVLQCSHNLPIYVSRDGFPDAFTNDGERMGSMDLDDLIEIYGDDFLDGQPVYFSALNNTLTLGLEVTLDRKQQFPLDGGADPVDIPVFIPSDHQDDYDDYEYLRHYGESFSYNIKAASTSGYDTFLKPIPLRGYCIYRVTARRLPVETVPSTPTRRSIYLPPTSDLDELKVTIGQWKGTKHTTIDTVDKGTFEALGTITIPEGELEAGIDVFLPVIWGAPLVYQCSEEVRVEALVNWQPIFHSMQYARPSPPVTDDVSGESEILRHVIDPSATYFRQALKHQNFGGQMDWDVDGPNYVRFPNSAAAYNDLESVLNLL